MPASTPQLAAVAYCYHPVLGDDLIEEYSELTANITATLTEAVEALYPAADSGASEKPRLDVHIELGFPTVLAPKRRCILDVFAALIRPDLAQAIFLSPETAANDPMIINLHSQAQKHDRHFFADPVAAMRSVKSELFNGLGHWCRNLESRFRLKVCMEEAPIKSWCFSASMSLRMSDSLSAFYAGYPKEAVGLILSARRLKRLASGLRDETLAPKIASAELREGRTKAVVMRGLGHEVKFHPLLEQQLGAKVGRFGPPPIDTTANVRPLYKIDTALSHGAPTDEQLAWQAKAELLMYAVQEEGQGDQVPENFNKLSEAQIENWFRTIAPAYPKLGAEEMRLRSREWLANALK